MQTDSTSRGGGGKPGLEGAFAAWRREPALQAGLCDESGAHLVIGGADGRVRASSPPAARIAEALAALDGASLARQLGAACPGEGPPRLARLRLDPRRIIPPSLFLVARAADDAGEPVFLTIPSGPTTLPKPAPSSTTGPEPAPPTPVPGGRAAETPAETPVEAVAEPPADAPCIGDRFLWRTDERGLLTTATGPLRRLAGRAWAEFATPADILEVRQTFRRVRASLDLDGKTVAAELSGAPTGRDGRAFRGFEGFGVVRAVEAAAPVALPPAFPPDDEVLLEPEPTAASPEDAATAPEAALSLAEHDAFREIARALGARYAGDDEAAPGSALSERGAGAVMPFPSTRPDLPPVVLPEVEGAGLLDGLPVAALVHRGERIIAVNRPFLDLTGHADAGALREAGLDAVFPGGAPGFRSGLTHETAITTADGVARPVEVTRGICAWEGAPAAILILRGLAEDDPRRALEAERLAREVQAGRAMGAEAALDALQSGVVTVDREGRVVTLNRAAAALFGASPAELVGVAFAALFDNGASLAGAPSGEGDVPGVILAGGRAMMLALAPPRADGHRVAVLHRLPDSIAGPAVTETAPRRAGSPLRLGGEIREPLDTILGLTRDMLDERYGPLGDRRYRACLSDIREAGERIRERATELSDLAAVEAGQIDLHPQPLALNEVVAHCVAVLQTEAARSRIVLRTSFSADLAELEADEASVRRAASLVIEHAIRRSSAGGQVIVSTGAGESAEVALRVRDGGHGPDAAIPQGTDEDPRLALPRALVQANGGQLRMSGRRDEGTLVEILLPVRRGAHG